MKCSICGRRLSKAFITIKSDRGDITFGPVCGRKVIVSKRGRRNVTVKPRPVKVVPRDPAQVDWLEVCGVVA